MARQTRLFAVNALAGPRASPPHAWWDGSVVVGVEARGRGCVHVCAGGRGCWPWRGRGACGAHPPPCHTGRACTHALPTTRPLGATASPTAHGASTTPLAHAHTQFKLTNEQLIKTCTLERQHTPTHSTPHKHTNTITQQHTITQAHQHQHRHHHTITMPPPALTHATPGKGRRTRSEADAYVTQGPSQRSNVKIAHTTRKPYATVPDPLPTTTPSPPNDEARGCRLRHLVSTYKARAWAKAWA